MVRSCSNVPHRSGCRHGECLKKLAVLRRSAVALRDLPQGAPHSLKVPDLAFNVIEMGARHTVSACAGPLRVMREGEQLADLIDTEAELAAAPDECQTLR